MSCPRLFKINFERETILEGHTLGMNSILLFWVYYQMKDLKPLFVNKAYTKIEVIENYANY